MKKLLRNLLLSASVVGVSPAWGHDSPDWHTVHLSQDGAGSRRVEVRLLSRSRDAIRIETRSKLIFSNGKEFSYTGSLSHLNDPSKVSVDCLNKVWLYERTGIAYKKEGAFWRYGQKFRNSPALTRDFEYVCRHFN